MPSDVTSLIELPPELERVVCSVEHSTLDIPSARHALEHALVHQFTLLSDGLLAELLLRRSSVSSELITQHMRNSSPRWQRDFSNAGALDSLLQDFAADVFAGQVKVFRLRDVPSLKIRVLGGVLPIWDDVGINRQLRELGSSLRYSLPGAQQITAVVLENLLGMPIPDIAVDARFILGTVGPKTASVFGPVFTFVRELAVSPYIDPLALGFSYDQRVVVRREAIEKLPGRQRDADTESECTHVLAHELLHACSHRNPTHGKYFESDWLTDISGDLCRFLQEPRSRSDILATFDDDVEKRVVDMITRFAPDVVPTEKVSTERVLEWLVGEDLIRRRPDGLYESAAYSEGRQWIQLGV